MTYLSDKAQSSRRYRYYFFYACVLALFVYFWPIIRVKIYPYVEPAILSYSTSKFAVMHLPTSVKTYISSREELDMKAKALELTVERLENELAEKNALIKEADLLTASGTRNPSATLVMYPDIRDVTMMYSTLTLSKGFKDGVEEKALVYIRGRQPVCSIIEVHDATSLCKLLSASDVVTEGVTASSSVLSLTGIGGGAFVADVARETLVTVGDPVYLSRDQSMMIGTITNIVRDNQATAWHVYVRGAYNPITSSVFYTDK